MHANNTRQRRPSRLIASIRIGKKGVRAESKGNTAHGQRFFISCVPAAWRIAADGRCFGYPRVRNAVRWQFQVQNGRRQRRVQAREGG